MWEMFRNGMCIPFNPRGGKRSEISFLSTGEEDYRELSSPWLTNRTNRRNDRTWGDVDGENKTKDVLEVGDKDIKKWRSFSSAREEGCSYDSIRHRYDCIRPLESLEVFRKLELCSSVATVFFAGCRLPLFCRNVDHFPTNTLKPHQRK